MLAAAWGDFSSSSRFLERCQSSPSPTIDVTLSGDDVAGFGSPMCRCLFGDGDVECKLSIIICYQSAGHRPGFHVSW